jgi:hypothetical protein
LLPLQCSCCCGAAAAATAAGVNTTTTTTTNYTDTGTTAGGALRPLMAPRPYVAQVRLCKIPLLHSAPTKTTV